MVHTNAEVSRFTSHETFTALVLRGAAAQLLIGLRERPELTAHLAARDPAPIAQSPADLDARNGGIALVPRASGDDDWLSCVETGLRQDAPAMQFIESGRIRDALFPWFEPSIEQPTMPEAWAMRLSDPEIANRALGLDARYALLIGGYTANGPMNGTLSCDAAPGAVGCFGFATGTRHTRIHVTLVDLARKELVEDLDVSETGTFS